MPFFRQHACVKARVNGREGVIVAGGASDASAALSSLEFFDLGMSKWLNLGRMREGRRFPGLMVMGKHLLVAGTIIKTISVFTTFMTRIIYRRRND